MTACIICGKQTAGSTGAAGIFWTRICPNCKDKCDKELSDRCRNVAAVTDQFYQALNKNKTVHPTKEGATHAVALEKREIR